MARLGGMMAALVSGGEAQPIFPDFDSVLLVTGQVVKPKRVLPVLGFDGQELWTSEMGLKLGSADVNAVPEGCKQGPAERPTFNWMREGIQPMEGGRYMVVDKTPITVSKRKRQEINLSSDE